MVASVAYTKRFLSRERHAVTGGVTLVGAPFADTVPAGTAAAEGSELVTEEPVTTMEGAMAAAGGAAAGAVGEPAPVETGATGLPVDALPSRESCTFKMTS